MADTKLPLSIPTTSTRKEEIEIYRVSAEIASAVAKAEL